MLATKTKPKTAGQSPDMRSEYRKANEKHLAKVDRMMSGDYSDDYDAAGAALSLAAGARGPGTRGDGERPPVLEVLPVRLLGASPWQPRTEFEQESLRALGASIATDGNRTPLIVWKVSGSVIVTNVVNGNKKLPEYFVLAGERRLRAAQLAGVPSLTCQVVVGDVQEAERISRLDNLHREDLTPLDHVRNLKAMLDAGLYATQAELAKAVGITPAALSNQLRVLELPEYWLSLISQEKLTLTHLRCLVPWAQKRSVLDEVQRCCESDNEGDRDWQQWSFEPGSTPPTVAEFEELLASCIIYVSRPVEGKHLYEVHSGLDAKGKPITIRDEDLPMPSAIKSDNGTLCVIDCGKDLGRRAFNVDVWNSLSAHAKAQRAKKAGGGGSRSDADDDEGTGGGTAGGGHPTAAELKAKRAKLDERYQRNLYEYRITTLQRLICDALKRADLHTLVWHLIAWSTSSAQSLRNESFGEAVLACGGKYKSKAGECYQWPALLSVVADDDNNTKTNELLIELLCQWYDSAVLTTWNSGISTDFIERAATQLGIDFAKSWQLDSEFLELHSKDQLCELWTEWSLPTAVKIADKKRSELLELFPQFVTPHRPVKYPKCLAKLKPCLITK